MVPMYISTLLQFKDKKMERKRNAQLYLVLRGVIAVLTAAGIWNEVTIMSTNLLVSMKNFNVQLGMVLIRPIWVFFGFL